VYSTVRALRPQESVENQNGDERDFDRDVRPHSRLRLVGLPVGAVATRWRRALAITYSVGTLLCHPTHPSARHVNFSQLESRDGETKQMTQESDIG